MPVIDQVIAGAIVAMDEHRILMSRGADFAPAQPPFKGRIGIGERIEIAAVVSDTVAGQHDWQEFEPGVPWLDAVSYNFV